MKASKLQMIKNLMLVKALIEKGADFVAIPVTSEAQRRELVEKAMSAVREARENDADYVQPDEAVNDDDEGMPNVLNIPADVVKEAIVALVNKIKNVTNDGESGVLPDGEKMPDGMGFSEVRGFGRLGFNDGVGIVVMATNNKDTYYSAQDAEYPTDSEPCGNPACQACHGAKTSSPVTSETKH